MHKHPQHFQLGRIVRTHGLGGNLVCIFDTDKPEAYTKLKGIFLERNNTLLPYLVKKISLRGTEVLINLEGIDTAERAAQLKGAEIYLPLDQLPKPTKNEFYLHDLIGCQMVDETHGTLGIVDAVIETAGQNLLSFLHSGKEVLLPLVKEFVIEVDTNSKILNTRLPDGLLEIYMTETKAEKDDALEEE